MHYLKKYPSRREFLRLSALASMGLATPFSSMTRMKTINSLLPKPAASDYKALICLFLHGGNDSYNMLMPKTGQAYTDYQATRSNLAHDSADMLGIEADVFGLHPDMPNIQQMYLDSEMAFISNAGTLVEPTTQAQYLDGTVPLPLGLFSHLDQLNHWQTAVPNIRTNYGWGGKIADLIGGQNGNQTIPMNLSLSGSNIFQYGLNNSEFSMDSNGPIMPSNWSATWGHNPERRAATDSLVNTAYSDMYMSSYTNIFKNALDAGEEFQAAILNAFDFTTVFSSHYVSQDLEMIAKTISVQNDLDFQRQIFWIRFHGWDHHDDLLSNQSNYLSVVDAALSEFNSALKEIGRFSDVTTFVISEFSRKLTSNGNGTDHAWGGNMMAMGGAVNGGSIYGTYPSLALNGNSQLIHNGTIIPDTATDSIFAELAMWYGISVSDLVSLFPNLGNFHDVGSLSNVNPPIGFMQLI
jgi:uncharacterized protein (DUF1501 family)